MTRLQKMIFAIGLAALGAASAAGVLWLRHLGLDRAGQWVTVAGFFVSTALGLAGLLLGWLTSRQAGQPVPARTRRLRRPGRQPAVRMRAVASGHGRVYQAGRDQRIHER